MKVLNKRGKSGNRKQGCLVNVILENTHDLVNEEIRKPRWLCDYYPGRVKRSLIPLQKIRRLKRVASLKNKEKFGVKHKYLRQDLTNDPNGMELEFK